METTAAPRLTEIASDWYEHFVAAGGNPGRGSSFSIEEGEKKAYQYLELGTAYEDFQPGNSTSYKMVLHDLVRPQADLELRRHIASTHVGNDDPVCRCLNGEPVDVNYFRPTAATKGMSAMVGGELLVSLPENFGGRCAVFSVHQGMLHTPDYVMERLQVRYGDAVPLAVYLSAFTDMVSRLRG